MTPRISKLRTQSLEAENRLSGERAQLITRFYKEMEGIDLPAPIKRARAFKYLLTHKAICINENELIVGERGPAPKATPTYPEVSLHSLQDLDILHNRPKVGFTVDAETRELYKNEIIPYWKGRSMRDKIFGRLPENWHSAYEAGIFTEFQEQRAPGHTVAGKKIFQKGLLDLKEEIAAALNNLNIKNNPADDHKKDELEAMDIAADAVIMYAHRHAAKIEELITTTHDENRKKELRHMADICRKVPANAPETFHEMLQHYWFIHLGVITEVNPWDSFNPGRLDQHLHPLYQQEISNQTLTDSDAKELL
ncbi:MAG TPA: pyruvate formate lyase family protein, partial [Salinivirga sp.]|uniref:pyruvate formate lyase family protein n=1 Tax=Salinivirga sp. TaxID=1970192 RepID=UPI002B45E4EE